MRVALILTPLPLAACASVGAMRSAPTAEGSSWAFHTPAGEVQQAACEALRSYGMYLLEVDTGPDSPGPERDARWSALAQKTSLWSWGEYVRVTVLPTDSTGVTALYVLTRRVLATNITATDDWSPRLVHRIGEVLAGRHPVRPQPCEVVEVARRAGGR